MAASLKHFTGPRLGLARLSLAGRNRRSFVSVLQSIRGGAEINLVNALQIRQPPQPPALVAGMSRAACVLSVDGIEADGADPIWVDAGGLVSCAFTHTFETTGTKSLSVQIADPSPSDYDTDNNLSRTARRGRAGKGTRTGDKSATAATRRIRGSFSADMQRTRPTADPHSPRPARHR